MQWSGALNEFVFFCSYYTFFISVICIIIIFLIRAVSVRSYRTESNSSVDFSRLSRIGNDLSVEHEIMFTVVALSLYFVLFISALIMNSSYFLIEIPHEFYINLIYAAPILIFTGLFLLWFYFSKPVKSRIKAARITWGGWLGLYHRMDDRYEYMRFEIQKLLSKLNSMNEKEVNVSYRALELVLQNSGENGCTARGALMDLDPYLWSDYQESLCDRSRSYSYSMVLALCGTIFLVSGYVPLVVGLIYTGDTLLFFILAASIAYWFAFISYLLEYRRELIKDSFTPKVCYEPTVDNQRLKHTSKPRL